MGERKGTNKYYPPDFDPKKHRSLDAYHGTHALRERARKLGQGILIIRFEMPYNIWCDGCKNHIGMGVRYNAEKSKVGMYYTTPIYKFRMKCHLCNNHFEIKTDPANHDYVIICGARRKEQRWDPKENEQIVPEDKNDQKKLAADAMYKLEHGAEDLGKGKGALPKISQLAAVQQQWKDDYMLNKHLRQKFRNEKKELKSASEKDDDLLKRASLELNLVPEHADDKRIAELLQYRTVQSYDEKQNDTREQIKCRPLFHTTNSTSSPVLTFTKRSSTESSISLQESSKKAEAHKKLGDLVTKGKFDPFASNAIVDKKSKDSLNLKKLGIVKKVCKSNDRTKNTGNQLKPLGNKVSDPLPTCGNNVGDLPMECSSDDQTLLNGPEHIVSEKDNLSRSDKIEHPSAEEYETENMFSQKDQTLFPIANVTIRNPSTNEDNTNALNSLVSMYSDSSEEDD